MKYRAHALDIRIQKFMDKKISQFPELKDRNAAHSTNTSRSYVWEDIVGLLKGAGVR